MDDIDKQKLQQNTQLLLDNLDAKDVLPYLFQESIITQKVWDEIVVTEPKTAHTRTTELLRRLKMCGPKAYKVFCSALDKHNYGFLREALEETVITEGSDGNVASGSYQNPQAIETERHQLHEETYKMDAIPRGHCVIINNYQSQSGSNEERRKGSGIDAGKLEETFARLLFDVSVRHNLTATQMVDTCTEFAIMDHKNFDCFVCCILTHGVKDHVCGVNGYLVPINKLTSCFRADFCPDLLGKPKLFFIQACQGDEEQKGYAFKKDAFNTQPDTVPLEAGSTDTQPETIPNEADFLYGYSTVPGFVSYRDEKQGSLYIKSLCENLSKYHQSEDLLSILTKVNKDVSAENVDDVFKQVPAPMSTLRKKVKFF